MVDNKKSFGEIFLCIKRKDKLEEFKKTFDLNDTNIEANLVKFAANFYKAPVVNYKGYIEGKLQDNKNRYSEVIAKTLVSEKLVNEWTKLEPVRPNHFDTNHNPSEYVDMKALYNTNRKEEILAKLLFYQRKVKGLGYIFDYQTPLKADQSDSYGKIDLLGYNEEDTCFSVIELKYRPSGSDETLLRCVLEAYTYYKLLDLDQIVSADSHDGISALRALNDYDDTKKAELVVLFDESSCTKEDGGEGSNLMLRVKPKIDSKAIDEEPYPSKTVVSQQYKECLELIETDKRDSLRTLCETILEQEPNLKQIRFVVLRVDTDSKSPYPTNIKGWSRKLDRLYRAETLLTISSKG